jgi:hypothetical protein
MGKQDLDIYFMILLMHYMASDPEETRAGRGTDRIERARVTGHEISRKPDEDDQSVAFRLELMKMVLQFVRHS